MCLAVPAKVTGLREKGKKVQVEQPGVKRTVLNALGELKKGEWVLVQQGFAVERIGEKEAREAWRLWNEAEQGKKGMGQA